MISIRKIRLLELWKTKLGLVISYSVITLDQVRLKLLDNAYFFLSNLRPRVEKVKWRILASWCLEKNM